MTCVEPLVVCARCHHLPPPPAPRAHIPPPRPVHTYTFRPQDYYLDPSLSNAYRDKLAFINKCYIAAACIHLINATQYIWMWLGAGVKLWSPL